MPADINDDADVSTLMNRVRSVGIVFLCVLCVIAGGSVVADSSYELSISGSTDTQDRTVTLQGNDYTVSNIGVVAPGEQITADVTAPAGADYNVNLYNRDGEIIASDRMPDGSGTAQLDGHDQAGSYILAVYADGSVPTIHPLVISSYDVSLNAPATAEQGAATELTVDVSNVAGTAEDLDTVQVVISKDGEDEAVTATKSGDGSYTASTTFSEQGDYIVYANVRGPDTANGRKELLGVSESTTVEVREPTQTATATSTATDTPNNGGGAPSDPATETTTATPSPTQTATETATVTATSTVTETSTPTPTVSDTATATPSNVVTPNQSTPTPTTTTSGLSTLVSVIAVLGFGFLARRR